ncbi:MULTISPECIES: DUF5320 family protein [Thermodesulfovibrio]|jgi:hypothetical protein|uniref:DUF5320 family protein n=1 Tax=Thermodesulfovibrio TaxID=28261 RepID=UPI002623A356|nr:DUF5320 family protein [Thermodesulfovibrio sp.]
MPWGDRTGPLGGRGMGYCGGASRYMDSSTVRGFGRGRGLRCLGGFRRRFRWLSRFSFFEGTFSPEELELLRREEEVLKRRLEALQNRIKEIERSETK